MHFRVGKIWFYKLRSDFAVHDADWLSTSSTPLILKQLCAFQTVVPKEVMNSNHLPVF